MTAINHYKSINTREIKEIIRLKQQHKTINEIATALGRTANSIRSFTHYYSLPIKLWTESENEILRNEYLTTPAKLLAKKLNRSRHSIYVQAQKLGLRKNTIRTQNCKSNQMANLDD
jgi:IS30 family transposase